MTATPYLPLWTDAYLADTAHLFTEEHGAYLLLLICAWRSPGCALPDDDVRLARMAGLGTKKWRKMRPLLEQFFTVDDRGWTQKRLLVEAKRVSMLLSQRSQAGTASALKRKKPPPTSVSTGEATKSQQPEPYPESKNPPAPDGAAPPIQPPPIPANLVRKPKNGPAQRGTRLTPDWNPTAEHHTLGSELGITGEWFGAETDKFRDYWIAKPGKDGCKLDWDATFRNWLRKAAEFAGAGPSGAGKSHATGNRPESASVVTALAELQDRAARGSG